VLFDSEREAHFDLIVLADTLYYIEPLTDARLKAIADSLSMKLAPGGLLLLVNHYFFGMDVPSRGTGKFMMPSAGQRASSGSQNIGARFFGDCLRSASGVSIPSHGRDPSQ